MFNFTLLGRLVILREKFKGILISEIINQLKFPKIESLAIQSRLYGIFLTNCFQFPRRNALYIKTESLRQSQRIILDTKSFTCSEVLTKLTDYVNLCIILGTSRARWIRSLDVYSSDVCSLIVLFIIWTANPLLHLQNWIIMDGENKTFQLLFVGESALN